MNGCQIVEDLVELHPQWFADWGGGLVWLSLPQDCVDEAYARRVHDAAQRAGGHASLVRAPESLHRLYTKTIPQHRALAKLSKRIKAAFDPRGVLNPGRMSAA
jgi:glycolate oxidase FAD binding subunit